MLSRSNSTDNDNDLLSGREKIRQEFRALLNKDLERYESKQIHHSPMSMKGSKSETTVDFDLGEFTSHPDVNIKPGSSKEEFFSCIDLFAGCGGLSLGLEEAGFTPLLFSEISPHAAETYIANRAGMEIIPVADIHNLTDQDLSLLKEHWRYKGVEDIDLVCGGPPCQGYSGIGHRRTFKLDKKDIPSNHLFQEMVRVIKNIRPKMFLFENVRGLLNAKWTPDGKGGEIFKAVLAEFKTLKDYHIRWDLLHAKNYGVPQNRPRIVMVGIRDDILPHWIEGPFFDFSSDIPSAVEYGFLPKPSDTPPTLVDLLSDLEDPRYLNKVATTEYINEPQTKIQRELRTTRSGEVLEIGRAHV